MAYTIRNTDTGRPLPIQLLWTDYRLAGIGQTRPWQSFVTVGSPIEADWTKDPCATPDKRFYLTSESGEVTYKHWAQVLEPGDTYQDFLAKAGHLLDTDSVEEELQQAVKKYNDLRGYRAATLRFE